VTGAVRAVGDGASGEDLVTLDTPRLILRQWQLGLTYRGTNVIADAEIVWYAIDNTG
jgi:hypothetical protein